ncbi:MAG: glycosyltransferase family 4 protein [Omnitrophica bacterium]|nr:glycosyltransferase family 4 protein [Candidatus Omnitrophota bacterium]
MNILYIANKGYFKGGGQVSLWNLVRRINPDKFIPHFICPSQGAFFDTLTRDQISVDIISYPHFKTLNMFAVLKAISLIKQIAIEKKIDLIHANGPRMNLLSGLVAKICKMPVVWHERTLVEKGMWDSDRFFSFLADKIICNSDAIRERFLKNGKIHKKVITIINGVDTTLFNPHVDGSSVRREFNIRDNEIVIGMAGRIEPSKGQLCFLKAARDLASKYNNLKFLIAGGIFSECPINYKRELEEFITKHNLEKKVIFAGVRNDMPQILAAMNIMVLAADAEACGRVLFEAMACAKPIVATNTGGTPEIVIDKETGLLVPPKNSKALVKAIIALLDDKDLAKQMGVKGRERVEKYFTIQEHVRKTEAVYEEILNGC